MFFTFSSFFEKLVFFWCRTKIVLNKLLAWTKMRVNEVKKRDFRIINLTLFTCAFYKTYLIPLCNGATLQTEMLGMHNDKMLTEFYVVNA